MSELVSVIELKIDLRDLVKKVRWLKNKNEIFREKILKEVEKDSALDSKIRRATLDLCYDREFCKQAGIEYSNIQEQDSRLIKTAIVYYLLER